MPSCARRDTIRLDHPHAQEARARLASIFDLHVHTNRGSPDSGLTPDELVAEATRIGLTGVMVTEHDGWPRHDFEQFSSKQQDLIMVRALEVYTPLGHVIALGLENHVSGFSRDIETIRHLRREVDRVGGFMILAHPFRFLFDLPGIYTQNKLFEDAATVPETPEAASEHPIFELVDETEVVNGGNIEVENRFAQKVAAHIGHWGTGGSDAHSTAGLGKGVTVFRGDVRNERDLLDALREGDFFPVEGFHVGKPSDYGRAKWWSPADLNGAR